MKSLYLISILCLASQFASAEICTQQGSTDKQISANLVEGKFIIRKDGKLISTYEIGNSPPRIVSSGYDTEKPKRKGEDNIERDSLRWLPYTGIKIESKLEALFLENKTSKLSVLKELKIDGISYSCKVSESPNNSLPITYSQQ
jgi:hypothetical protein